MTERETFCGENFGRDKVRESTQGFGAIHTPIVKERSEDKDKTSSGISYQWATYSSRK